MKFRFHYLTRAIALLLLVWSGGSAWASPSLHPVHFTTTWIRHDPATQRVSITIEVYGEEFAWAVGEHAKRAVKLERLIAGKSAEDVRAVMAYVNEKFELKDSAGHGIALEWIKPVKHEDMFQLHLKGKMPTGLAGATLRNLLLCDSDEDQVNTVFTEYQGRKIETKFADKDGFKPITRMPPRH